MNPDENQNQNLETTPRDDYPAIEQPQPGTDFQQNTVISPTPKSKRGIFIGVTIIFSTLLILSAVFLTFGSTSNDTSLNNENSAPAEESEQQLENFAQSYDPNKHPRDLELSLADDGRLQVMTNIQLTNGSYRLATGKYYTDAADITAFLQKNDETFYDPGTNQPFTYTDSAPKRNELQYKLGFLCTDNLRGIGDKTKTNNIFLFVVLMDDGSYLCKSNVQ